MRFYWLGLIGFNMNFCHTVNDSLRPHQNPKSFQCRVFNRKKERKKERKKKKERKERKKEEKEERRKKERKKDTFHSA